MQLSFEAIASGSVRALIAMAAIAMALGAGQAGRPPARSLFGIAGICLVGAYFLGLILVAQIHSMSGSEAFLRHGYSPFGIAILEAALVAACIFFSPFPSLSIWDGRAQSVMAFYAIFRMVTAWSDLGPVTYEAFEAMRHPLAWSHVLMACTAKILALWGALLVLSGRRPGVGALVLVLQGMAILFGMIWARDALEWGALWQWDGIELIALSLFLVLLGGHTDSTKTIWAWGVVWIVALQCGFIHVSAASTSRHVYGTTSIALAWAIFLIAWSAAAWWILRDARRQRTFWPLCLLCLMIGLILCAAMGVHLLPEALYVVYAGLGVALACRWHGVRWGRRIALAVTLAAAFLTLPFVAAPSRMSAWVATSFNEDASQPLRDVRLYALRATPTHTAALRYELTLIKADGRTFGLSFLQDDSMATHMSTSATVASHAGLWEYRAFRFRADLGLLLVATNVLPSTLWCFAVFLAFILILGSLLAKPRPGRLQRHHGKQPNPAPYARGPLQPGFRCTQTKQPGDEHPGA